jgi:hypothetical protein
MKPLLVCALLVGGPGLLPASIVESISLNLSALHAGSTLSGTFTLPDSPIVGDTAPVTLSFSDPSDYSASPLSATITIESGTTLTYDVRFSEITFTNPSGNMFTTDVDLTAFAAAQCASFPCTATGGVQDGSPAAFTSTYSITPDFAPGVPEPGYGVVVSVLLAGFVIGRRFLRTV